LATTDVVGRRHRAALRLLQELVAGVQRGGGAVRALLRPLPADLLRGG